ncbi:hypothetical protein [Cellulomonas marina]|uniref:Uncharacterized protein n=1 Tax=Cellulomonas marina TaxID=988821 RepID=A0A1I0XCD9_9CELL|nr:hypothetical protein [Cellulomonas marina]GIG29530.1 hypothetical protein Cma02nite_21300 [Cellulomonas marina]SFA97593.1 hypothetical protein SAMN05421867_104224 [Cellulomonas marina]
MRKRLSILSLVGALAVTLVAGPAVAAGTVVVNETNLGVDWHSADTRLGGTRAFTTVGGRSALQMVTDETNAAKVQTFTSIYDGRTLNDITSLSYTTWRDGSSTGFVAGSVALNLVVDTDGNASGDTYLVYEPYLDKGNDAVRTNTWQTWDAIAGGSGTWWINTGAGGCGASAGCTWNQVKAIIGNAPLTPETAKGFKGSLGLNLGSYNPGLVTAVDTLEVNGTTYDFAPRVFSKADCTKGGWATNFPADMFINQGDCVSYFASNGKTHK